MERLKLLLIPSILSGFAVVFVAAAVVGATAWSYVQNNQLFYELLFGAYGFKTILLTTPNSIFAIKNAITNSSGTYYILLLMCGILASITVYTLLESFGRTKRATAEVLHEIHLRGPAYKKAVQEAFARLVLRTTAVIGWTIYMVVFVSIIVPYTLYNIDLGIDKIADGNLLGWAYCVVSFGSILLFLHLHIVFLRLCLLRPRVFGGIEQLEEAEAHMGFSDDDY